MILLICILMLTAIIERTHNINSWFDTLFAPRRAAPRGTHQPVDLSGRYGK